MDITRAKAEQIGHLGLIASTLQDTGLMDVIDQKLGVTDGSVKYGHRVGAMILNGLGFINTALYMTPRFFYDKPLDLLLGAEISAEQLNDDCLGRCLDKIATYGTTKWYSEVALAVVSKAGLLTHMAHLDSTTFNLYGGYHGIGEDVSPKPTYGYSKDHRPDLKQVTLQCISLGKSALPIWMEALDGNSSDKASFPETVKRVDAFYKEVVSSPKMCFVADSALYGESLESLNVDWLTRVPETYREAKNLCDMKEVKWMQLSDSRYQVYEYTPNEKQERWILVRSEPGYQRENETLIKKHGKIFDELQKALWHCSCQEFNCDGDAKKAIEKIIHSKKHFYDIGYKVIKVGKYSNKGRPNKNQEPESYCYQIKITGISSNLIAITSHRETLGRFVLATNVFDENVLTTESMLIEYKEQSEIERGFRFIKNDTFGLDEIYLKKPERIGALMAVMTLCLLVYGLTQYKLREELQRHNEVLPTQTRKPTNRPTLLWIFTLFSSITMIKLNDENMTKRIVLNLQPLHHKVILLLGETARRIYFLPDKLTVQDIVLNQKNWLKWCGM